MKSINRLHCCLLLIVLLAGCIPNRAAPAIHLTENTDETTQEILKHIPVGSSIEHAEQAMLQEGFECSHKRDSKGTFLYCDIQKHEESLVTRRWQILIRYQESKVRSVSVTTGLIGL